MYYKIVKDNIILGIATSANLIRYQTLHKMYPMASEFSAEAIVCKDIIYHADWMLEFKAPVKYVIADVISINEEEFNILSNAFETNETVEDNLLEEFINDDIIEEVFQDYTIDFVKNTKIKEMKRTCRLEIEKGVDVVLSDGNNYHFSLTTQDQLNLTTLSAMIMSGEELIPYHADGELCKYFSVEDISTLISIARKHISYHTTYYNSLKSYILALGDIKDIDVIVYGCDIPKEYQSEVLLSLYK